MSSIDESLHRDVDEGKIKGEKDSASTQNFAQCKKKGTMK